jgi:hypothetical protein
MPSALPCHAEVKPDKGFSCAHPPRGFASEIMGFLIIAAKDNGSLPERFKEQISWRSTDP